MAGQTPIRIAFCITELDVGGAERCLVELATGLDRGRFLPTVFSLAAVEGSPLAAQLREAGIEVHGLGARSIWDTRRVIRDLARRLAAFDPDVVQTFLFHANLLGRLAAKRAADHGTRKPAVVSGIRVAERRTRWHARLERWTQRYVNRHVCVSRDVADYATKVGGLAPRKIVVIPNGVDAARFESAHAADLKNLGMPAGRRALVYVGRLEQQKRVDWLIDRFAAVAEDLPQHDLLIVGEGPLRSRLEKRAADRGVGERVHFAGFSSDVPSVLRASDLLVLASAWEGMPNVVLEAMAAGLAVVATAAEGVREALSREESAPSADNPQVVERDDSAGFERAVVRLASDDELRRQLAAENQRIARSRHSVAAMVAHYAALYEELVASRETLEK